MDNRHVTARSRDKKERSERWGGRREGRDWDRERKSVAAYYH